MRSGRRSGCSATGTRTSRLIRPRSPSTCWAGLPAELALRLRVRGPADAGHHRVRLRPGGDAHEPAGQPPRRRGADVGGHRGQPGRDRRRLVVDDVVDRRARRPRSRRPSRSPRRRCARTTTRRPRCRRPAKRRLRISATCSPSTSTDVPRPVEAAVAQHEALEPVGAGHGPLEMADGGERLADVGRRVGVERVVLGLDRRPGAGDRPAGVALPDEPAGARRASRPRSGGRCPRCAGGW